MSDEIVISGVAGRFPQSDNVKKFEENLSNGVYMVGDSENRNKWIFPNHPRKFGLVKRLEKFDSKAFHLARSLAMDKCNDPQSGILLEHVFEAILDAGVNPKSIIGTKTGVYVGCMYFDSLNYWMYGKTSKMGVASYGNSGYALANKISYALGARGPSMSVDSACSSSLTALNLAFRDIKNGHCDAAIVAGTNLILNPMPTDDSIRYVIIY